MIDISIINQVVTDVQTAIGVALPEFPLAPILLDTQANRLNWRELLNRLEAGDPAGDVGDFKLPWLVIEVGPSRPWGASGICNHGEILPVTIVLITSAEPVSTTVSTVVSTTAITVPSASGVFHSQRIMVNSVPFTVSTVVGNTITFTAAHGALAGDPVESYNVTGEITRMMELLRNEIYQNPAYTFQMIDPPSIDTSSICAANQNLLRTDYAVQGGQMTCQLLCGVTWA